MNQPTMDAGLDALLYLTRAYAFYDSKVSEEQLELRALLDGKPIFPIRLPTDPEKVPFDHVDQSAVIELKKPPFSLERYVWVPHVELRFPPTRPVHASADTTLYVGLGRCLPGISVIFFSLSITFPRTPETEETVAILQSHLRDDQSRDGLTIKSDGTIHTSCLNFIKECAKRMGIREECAERVGIREECAERVGIREECAERIGIRARAQWATWITELRTGQAETIATCEDDDDLRRTYGLLTADEGWSYVPATRAKEIADHSWSSRRFLWVGAFGSGVVVYNDKPPEYGEAITRFFREWFGASRQYFADAFQIAGLDHGILYSLEAATLLKLTAECFIQDIKDTLRFNERTQTTRLRWSELTRGHLGSMQLRAFQFLDHVRDIGIGELGNLDRFIADETGLTRIVNDVKRYAELIDGQLTNVTTLLLNIIVILLGFIAAVAAATAAVPAVIALLHL
jgi:hypothetical protein